ncbi:MAG: YedE-related selenium metabolism membrane protein [Deltaproteobacteria bacterium]|nr:YedE-related selenium metabolism membrane protein [Deltaproteobacteria bacterium]
MGNYKNFFATSWGVIGVGAFIGLAAALLQKAGNPPNMGVCVACMTRDIAGAIGLHRAAVVQYIRPEIIGLVLGALAAALVFKEFRPRGGSSPLVRFVLGMLAMIGALVFLGCPWRALLRLAGGDGNAILGLAGLAVGIFIGTRFFKIGYTLGRSTPSASSVGWLLPGMMAGLLILLVLFPQEPGQDKSGILFYSLKGPGSQHAAILISLAAGLLIGFVAQRSRFCTMGALRDLILFRQTHLFGGLIALVAAAFLTNLALGQFKPGFTDQPIAHTQHLWNFAGMVLAGLAFALAGGCPGRQLFLAGEGDADAGVFILGMLVGAALSHNFELASSAAGIGPHGMAAVIVGLILCLVIGFTMRLKTT